MSDPIHPEPEPTPPADLPVEYEDSRVYVELSLPQPTEPVQARHRRNDDAGWLRLVIVMWCFWLLGAWAVAWLSDTSVPRVRWMLFAGSFGMMLVWPAFRLSESVDPTRPGRQAIGPIFLDWLGLVLVYQAVIWSLHLMAMWPLMRGIWLDAAVMSWSLLSALIVATARRWPGAIARSIGMLLCIALVFAEPLYIWLLSEPGHEWVMRISPIQALWELTEPPARGRIHNWSNRIITIGLVAALGWVILGLWAMGERLVDRKRRKQVSPTA